VTTDNWQEYIDSNTPEDSDKSVGVNEAGFEFLSDNAVDALNPRQCHVYSDDRSDSMEILLSHESVKQVWDARDRASLRAIEHVGVTGPSAKEAESWALQPG